MTDKKSNIKNKNTANTNLKNSEHKIICIDGGGTKTNGALFIGDEIVSEYKVGTTRLGAVGQGESCTRTLNVMLELCKRAGITIQDIDICVIGIAGVWLDIEKTRSINLIKTLAKSEGFTINDLIVTSDVEIAFEGAFGDEPGIVTIVGTGSIGLAKCKNGNIVRCGGWGIELDDEGSGAWVGREGLTAVMRDIDGRGEHTMLTEKLRESIVGFNIEEPRSIVKAFNDKVFEYQTITPWVMECAMQKDLVCNDLMEKAAKHLVQLPMTLMKNFDDKNVNLALMGGIIDNDTLLSQMLHKELKKIKGLKVVKPKGNSIDGARNIGLKVIKEIYKN